MSPERLAASAAAGLLLVLGAVASLRPQPGRAEPEPLPATGCEDWMADAIPRVGPKTRAAVAEGIRHGAIPPAAQAWFR